MTDSLPAGMWQEEHSHHFLDLGRIYTPRRDELQQAFLDLIPAWPEDAFTAVDLASGEGWLSLAILESYPRSRVIALDPSEAMRDATASGMAKFGDRGAVQAFTLEDAAWRTDLPDGLRAIVSSLAIHHLHGAEKAQLFADLLPKLAPGGALLIADLASPAGYWSQRHFARAWAGDVARQSVERLGDDSAYRRFMDDRWNYYENSEEENAGDYPSTIADHIAWLTEAGYVGVDVGWARAGHTLFCAYRPE